MGKRTRLFYKSVSEIIGGDGIGVITLTDESEQRALSVVCDHAMMYQLGLRNAAPKSREKLLPEVLATTLAEYADIDNFELNIFAVVEGSYKVALINTETLKISRIRMSDAVLLMRISGIPLFIDNELFNRQASKYSGASNRMAIPINTLPTDKLKEELQHAIDTENYRLASVLKDEIGKRRTTTDNSQDTDDL